MKEKVVYQLSVRQILLIVFAAAMLAAGTVVGVNYFTNRLQPTTNAENVAAGEFNEDIPAGVSDPRSVSDEQNNIEVYRAISPGVAFITTTSLRQDYFGNQREGRGSGSGSVIDNQGHILTNEHVIGGATQLTVDLGGGKKYPAEVVGKDPDTDLAVIKIVPPQEGLTVVPFGDSDRLTVGQKVLAIGNPFGLDRTLTTGVISGLQRPIEARNGRQIEGAIQTDASINPGNSGGPLLDSRGRIIGINSQILSPSGASNGIGFAVPASIARRVVPQLIQFGEVRRPKLGVRAYPVAAVRQQGVQLPVENGLYIDAAIPGGSAERAGLRGTPLNENGSIGDIVLSADGQAVNDIDDLYRVLDRRQIGDTIQVEVYRGNSRVTLPVRLLGAPAAARPVQTAPQRRF